MACSTNTTQVLKPRDSAQCTSLVTCKEPAPCPQFPPTRCHCQPLSSAQAFRVRHTRTGHGTFQHGWRIPWPANASRGQWVLALTLPCIHSASAFPGAHPCPSLLLSGARCPAATQPSPIQLDHSPKHAFRIHCGNALFQNLMLATRLHRLIFIARPL